MQTLTYRRALLKLSGEALVGDQGYGIDANTLQYISTEIQEIQSLGVELAVVIGGGNVAIDILKKEPIDVALFDLMMPNIDGLELMERAKALEAQGAEVVHFEVGEPDFSTAPSIVASSAFWRQC